MYTPADTDFRIAVYREGPHRFMSGELTQTPETEKYLKFPLAHTTMVNMQHWRQELFHHYPEFLRKPFVTGGTNAEWSQHIINGSIDMNYTDWCDAKRVKLIFENISFQKTPELTIPRPYGQE